jgi:hypothetical protein
VDGGRGYVDHGALASGVGFGRVFEVCAEEVKIAFDCGNLEVPKRSMLGVGKLKGSATCAWATYC